MDGDMRLKSFGVLAASGIMEAVKAYPVTADDVIEVENWFTAKISDNCGWSILETLDYFVPHLWTREGADFIARLSILGYLERHCGFSAPKEHPLKFYAEVDSVLESIADLEWQDAYRIVNAVDRVSGGDPIASYDYPGWFREAGTTAREVGIDVVVANAALFVRGLPASVVAPVLANGVDSELLDAFMNPTEPVH